MWVLSSSAGCCVGWRRPLGLWRRPGKSCRCSAASARAERGTSRRGSPEEAGFSPEVWNSPQKRGGFPQLLAFPCKGRADGNRYLGDASACSGSICVVGKMWKAGTAFPTLPVETLLPAWKRPPDDAGASVSALSFQKTGISIRRMRSRSESMLANCASSTSATAAWIEGVRPPSRGVTCAVATSGSSSGWPIWERR